ncbi:MAG: ERF family protein [Hyphomonadaceae bacterium]
MIERVAANPDIPVERVEQLFKLYTQMDAERARRSYHAAFAQMQPSLPAVERKGKSHNGKYARFEDVIGAVMPVLAEHGFGLSFRTSEAANKVTVTCLLSHKDGHSESTEYAFPYDGSGNKNAIQAIASAISYGKRYTMNALLGIATRDEDDDGNAACAGDTISEEQFKKLAAALSAKNIAPAKFCQAYKIANVGDLPARKFDEALGRLNKAEVNA